MCNKVSNPAEQRQDFLLVVEHSTRIARYVSGGTATCVSLKQETTMHTEIKMTKTLFALLKKIAYARNQKMG
ncbi:hypothetical protein BG910_03540 [Neisseria chenwenguii]|uniref:Uncharacterized protein n=1 Tax=Neisseria chenwenguii TaxID=1853278 RepID=A0A220S0G1_9NEIS|nr:hypothetical protein BG910_03540 [Neisseria chenwenguii]